MCVARRARAACAVYRRLASTDRITEIAAVYLSGSIEIS